MFIDKVYKAVQLFANKSQVGGYISPAEFNRYAEFAQLDWINDNYNPATKLGYENNYQSSDDFAELKVSQPITVANGLAVKPADYMHYSSAFAYTIFNGESRPAPAQLVRDVEWSERLMSEINKPTRTFPILRSIGSNFQVKPDNVNQIVLNYIKLPLQPWWNYTIVSGIPVFAATGGVTTNPNPGVTAGNSTNFVLGEDNYGDLVFRICRYFGIEVREAELYQFVNNEAQQEV